MANIRGGYTENRDTYMGGAPRKQRSWASNLDDAAPSAFGAPAVDLRQMPGWLGTVARGAGALYDATQVNDQYGGGLLATEDEQQ